MDQLKKEIEKAKDLMDKALVHTAESFSKLRAGKAMPSMLDGIKVDYYGSMVPISQVASVNSIDARTLVIKPWDKGALKHIEESIVQSYLDITPQNDGEVIHLNIPPLTEETRTKLTKQVKNESEKNKVSIRTIRKNIKDDLKKLQKEHVSEDLIRDTENDLQKMTDDYIKKIDDLTFQKNKEIMEL